MAEEKGDEKQGEGLSDDEIRQRLQQELRKVKVSDLLLQSAVTLVNLGFQRLGLTEETKDDRDLGQAQRAIDALRALMPLVQQDHGDQAKPLMDALSQLQLQYAAKTKEEDAPQAAGKGEGASEEGDKGAEKGAETATARTGRAKSKLWTPPGV